MSLTPQWLDELRARTTLSALIGRTVRVQKAGREFKACCPFHNEKTPSFTINDEKGFYHCFGCGAHGDAIRWMTDHRGLAFMDAVKELAADAGMEVPAADPTAARHAEKRASLHDVMRAAQDWFVEQLGSIEGAQARAYLERRTIRPQTVREFGFGFAPDSRHRIAAALKQFPPEMLIEAGLLIAVEDKAPYDRFRGRLMIPIRDARGRVIAFGGRILGDGEPKYLNSPDTPLFDKGRTLYNLDKALPAARSSGRIIVVEGYMDAIALAQAGFADVVAPLGTALTEIQIEMLWRSVERPLLCFDGDSAGQKATIRAAMRSLPLLRPGHSLDFLTLPAGQDPDDLIRDKGSQAMAQLLEVREPLVDRLWRHERDRAPLTTPEDKAGLRQRLHQHVENIANNDIRRHYADAFDERIQALFARPRPPGNQRFQPRGTRFAGPRGVAPQSGTSSEARAIGQRGQEDLLVAAVIGGLLHFPDMIAVQFEALSTFRPADPDAAAILGRLLAAIPQKTVLDDNDLLTILGDSRLYNKARQLSKAGPLSFTFNRSGRELTGEPEVAGEWVQRARKDLAEAIRVMVERPLIETALTAANMRFETDLDEESYTEQQRLRAARDAFDARLADLMQPDEV